MSLAVQQEITRLQNKARHDPAVWALMRRAAMAAAQATQVEEQSEEAINKLAEDIIRRADSDPAVLKLLQQAVAAAAAPSHTPVHPDGHSPHPRHIAAERSQPLTTSTHSLEQQQPPPPENTLYAPALTSTLKGEETMMLQAWDRQRKDPESVLAEALGVPVTSRPSQQQQQDQAQRTGSAFRAVNGKRGSADGLERVDSLPLPVAAGILGESESVLSSDTEGPIPIIPIRSNAALLRKKGDASPRTPAPPPPPPAAAADRPMTSPTNAELLQAQQCFLQGGGGPLSTDVFAERLKAVLDRYRAGVAERCRLATELSESLKAGKDQTVPTTTTPCHAIPSPTNPGQSTKLALLRAAYDAGALTQRAYALAVAEIEGRGATSPQPQSSMPPIPPLRPPSDPHHKPLLGTTALPSPVPPIVRETPRFPSPLVIPPRITSPLPLPKREMTLTARVSPKRLISPTRPRPEMTGATPDPLPVQPAPSRQTPTLSPRPDMGMAKPPSTGQHESQRSSPMLTSAGERERSSAQRSHSQRMLMSKAKAVPCRTPLDPARTCSPTQDVWKPPVEIAESDL